MEGLGSRLGRASSRYGGPASVAFNGPVRKWKKEWVHVSSSPTVTSKNPHAHSTASTLLLRRWTPISSAPAAADEDVEEPPRRKFRYTPIAVLEEQKHVAEKKVDNTKTNVTDQSVASPTIVSEERNIDVNMRRDTQELDLGLCLKRHDDSHESSTQNRDNSQGRAA